MQISAELSLYQQLNDLYSRIVDAAHGLRWDDAIALQAEVDRLVADLARHPASMLDRQQRQYKAQLIEQILEKQTLVRQEISDWQSDVAPLLSVGARAAPEGSGIRS